MTGTGSCWQVVVGCLAWQMAAGTQWCLVFRALSLWLLFEHTTFKSDCERRCRPVYFQLFAASAKAPRVSSHMIVKHPFKNSVIQQTSSSLIKFNIINITFSTTYFLHPRLPHSATISRNDHTLSCFRNTVDTLWTLNFITRILYKNIYWRYSETIYTYTESMINWHYIASFYHCCKHLAFCQAWSLNEYVMLCYAMPVSVVGAADITAAESSRFAWIVLQTLITTTQWIW